MLLRFFLFNLVANAVKFTATGEVSVLCKAETESNEKVRLLIDVKDTGIGIPAEKLNTIFDAFSQADNSITRRFGGTGLGLTISRLLIERMNGTLQVSSIPGQGSTFTVSIPGMAIAQSQPAATVSETNYTALNGMQVLVCDDEELNRIVAQQLLEHYGIKAALFRGRNECLSRKTIYRAAASRSPH